MQGITFDLGQWALVGTTGVATYFLVEFHKTTKALLAKCVMRDEHEKQHERDRVEWQQENVKLLNQISSEFKICKLEHGGNK